MIMYTKNGDNLRLNDEINLSNKLQVIAQIITIQLIVDKEKYSTQRLVCVLFLDNNLHLN